MKLILSNPKVDQIKSNLFFSGMLAIIIVVLWIVMSIYTTFSNHKPDTDMKALLAPIDPTIDLDVLEKYQSSRVAPPQEFEIKVRQKDKIEASEYSLNPFTNDIRQPNPSPAASTSSQVTAKTLLD